ncbi:UNVERIFIED_CONTAM: methyltransferase domain-containing protein [Spiribacter pallidus]
MSASSHSNPLALDRRVLHRRVEAAVPHFDAAAVLHREVGARLLDRLAYMRLDPATILDLGCGSGFHVRGLRKRYPRARLVLADLAPGLVARARRSAGRWRRPPGVACHVDQLPFGNDQFDLIFSSLALHRSSDLAATARELQRLLRPGGVLLFATYGPDTLHELRTAWAQVDAAIHVHGFVDMHDIGDALVNARLADPVMDMEHFTLTYPDVSGLVDDLTALGLRNAAPGRRPGLTTPRQWRAMQSAYEAFRDADGRLPATWEIAYGHAWGTDAQPQLRQSSGVVEIPLDTLSVPKRSR